MIQQCFNCMLEFYDIAISSFCCNKCEINYWKLPKQILIFTECPECKKEFSRTIFTVEARNYQALTVCHNCAPGSLITVCNSRTY